MKHFNVKKFLMPKFLEIYFKIVYLLLQRDLVLQDNVIVGLQNSVQLIYRKSKISTKHE